MTEPFFLTKESLKKKLQLSGAREAGEVDSILDDCITLVHEKIRTLLGDAKIAELKAVEPSTNPETPSEHNRALASTAEVLLTRAQVLRLLPARTTEDAGRDLLSWNVEAPLRRLASSERSELIQFLEEKGNELLKRILGSSSSDSQMVNVATTESISEIYPGFSIDVMTPETRAQAIERLTRAGFNPT